MLAKILRSVDLPAPLGPIRPMRSPARRSREMSVNRGRGPYALLRPCELRRTVIVGTPLLKTGVGSRSIVPSEPRPSGSGGEDRSLTVAALFAVLAPPA